MTSYVNIPLTHGIAIFTIIISAGVLGIAVAMAEWKGRKKEEKLKELYEGDGTI